MFLQINNSNISAKSFSRVSVWASEFRYEGGQFRWGAGYL